MSIAIFSCSAMASSIAFRRAKVVCSTRTPPANQLLLTSYDTCGTSPEHYSPHVSGDACKPDSSFLEADSKYDGPLYVRGSCMPVMDASGTTSSVKAVPDSEFMALEGTTLTTDPGRLKPMYLSSPDGSCLFGGWWDEQLQTPCSFASNGPGTPYYCLPSVDETRPGKALETFSDSACTVASPILEALNCSGAKPPRFFIGDSSSCGG